MREGTGKTARFRCDTCGQPIAKEERVEIGTIRRFPPRNAHSFHFHVGCVPPLFAVLMRKENR